MASWGKYPRLRCLELLDEAMAGIPLIRRADVMTVAHFLSWLSLAYGLHVLLIYEFISTKFKEVGA